MCAIEIYAHISTYANICTYKLQITVNGLVSNVIDHLGVAQYVCICGVTFQEIDYSLAPL